MKWHTILFTFVTVLLSVFACTKEVPAELNINTSELSFDKDGGSQNISISTNKDWTATSSASWVTVQSSGTSSTTSIAVQVAQNPDYDDRTATVTIKAEKLTKTVNIKQSTNIGLIVSKTEYDLTNDAQTIEIEIQHNVNYEISIDDACKSWITRSDTKGLTTDKVKFNIAKNESYDDRTGKITIKQTDGLLFDVVTVKQSQTNGLFITTPEYSVSNSEQDITIEVKANIEFEVKSNADWITYVETKSLQTSNVTLKIAKNQTYDERIGQVIIKQNNGHMEGVISITQAQTDTLFFLGTKTFDIPSKGQVQTVQLFHNDDYEIEDVSLPSWITYKSTQIDYKNTQYTFEVDKNTDYYSRTAHVVFRMKNHPIKDTISFIQHQLDTVYFNTNSLDLSWHGGEATIVVYSNVEYTVEKPDWIIEKFKSSNKEGSLLKTQYIYSITDNLDNTRTGTLMLHWINEGVTTMTSFTIVQKPCTIDLSQSGTLKDSLTADQISKIKILYLNGQINEKDIIVIRKMESLCSLDMNGVTNTELPDNALSQLYFTKLVLPSKLTFIPDYFCQKCTNLEEVIIPSTVVSVGTYAFYDCNLKGDLVIGDNVTYIGTHAFQENHYSSITIGEGLEEITVMSFSYNRELTTINLGKNIRSIHDGAFNSSDSLKGIIEIPEKVEYIGNYNFTSYYPIKGIDGFRCLNPVPPKIEDDTFANYDYLEVPKGCIDTYRNSKGWKKFLVIEEIK